MRIYNTFFLIDTFCNINNLFFVIISLQNNKRVPSPQHQQFNSTICDTPRNRNQHSTPAKRNQSSLNNSYSPNKSLEDADVSNLNTSGENNRVSSKNSNSNKDGNSTSPKKEIAPDEQAFRRQHFDRNSILRTSKKRSRKSSMNNSNNAGNSTPNRILVAGAMELFDYSVRKLLRKKRVIYVTEFAIKKKVL